MTSSGGDDLSRDSLGHALDADGQIFGHESGLYGLNANGFQSLSKDLELYVLI